MMRQRPSPCRVVVVAQVVNPQRKTWTTAGDCAYAVEAWGSRAVRLLDALEWVGPPHRSGQS
eukprot:2649554-Alexandrium_andersonii.AAC.1